jgi:hypothetical protein
MIRIASLLALLLLALPFAPGAAMARDLVLEKYFAGTTLADGKFTAINGVSRAFKVKLSGSWNGKRLKLVEDFVYDDGERDRKTWFFTKVAPNQYKGTREDVVGETLVTVSGDTARFTYQVYLDGAARKGKVRFHDKMTLRPDGTVLNNALVTKFGFPVGKTRVEFRRPAK